ncbi:MAG: sigma-70 family RNA polymerase sigma factor [Actinomycetia bacterium]|nr:sigma-70 family RNA polymerase sigma factor [Actinomycetes bacterium]MCP4961956.1 sigma-70 family RNA polymerase sigma factor [Actinomycetes bacterium]
MDVEALAKKAKAGDEDAFTALVKVTHADTYTLAHRLTGNADDASDVVQEAYIRAYRNLKSFRGDAKFSTWMYRITANCASTHLSKRRMNHHDELTEFMAPSDNTPVHDPDFVVMNGSLRTALVDALQALPQQMRAVVVLRDVYDLPHDNIAEELGISVTAAKVRLHRARKRLRDLVGDPHESEARRAV